MFDPIFFEYWRERMGPIWWRVFVWSHVVVVVVVGLVVIGL